MSLIKRDPFSIAVSLTLNLNLLQENEEFNINQLKSLRKIDLHWNTIQKYLKITKLIKNYFPEIEVKNSKFKIIRSKLYNLLNEKEKFIVFLFNHDAINEENALYIPKNFNETIIIESLNYLYKKNDKSKYYLIESGLDVYKSIIRFFMNIIYNNKDTDNHTHKKRHTINLEKFPRVIKIYDEKIISEKMKSIQISGQLLEIVI